MNNALIVLFAIAAVALPVLLATMDPNTVFVPFFEGLK